VKLGVSPYGLPLAQYVDLAVSAEQAGFESVWVPDHLIVPAQIGSRFPYSPDGESGMTPSTEIFDAWVLLSFMAAATERINFGPFVYILPLRHPFATAKATGSLQILSGGRLLLGVGVGWLAEEYEAMGGAFRRRGADTSESIAVMRALWSQDVVRGDGPAYRFHEVGMAPRPAQTIPIHLGGHSPAAIRRATELGDGWLASPRPESELRPLVAEMTELIDAGLRRAGRERAGFEITAAVLGMPSRETMSAAAEDGVDRLIISPWAVVQTPPSPSQVAEQVHELAGRLELAAAEPRA
jgi:probable F420-dependent oxidoreductase